MPNAKALREKRAGLVAEIDELADRNADAEREWSGADEEHWQKVNGAYNELSQRIDRIERAEQIAAERAEREAEKADRTETAEDSPKPDPEKEQGDAFRAYLRGGMGSLSMEHRTAMAAAQEALPPEARAMSVATTTAGGHTVPAEFDNRVYDIMLAFGGMMDPRVSEIIRSTDGRALSFATGNDTANTGELTGTEGTQITNTADPTFGLLTLNGWMYDSQIILISIQLLQDSAWDIEKYLVSKLAERLWRIMNTHWTTGSGTSRPHGLTDVIDDNSLSSVTAASATVVTSDELLDLQHGIDPAYRNSRQCVFVFNDTTCLELRKLRDGDGNKVWSSGFAYKQADTIHGWEYVINTDMPDTATGNIAIVAMAQGEYKVRIVRNPQLVRFGEKYMNYLQIGFLMFQRADGDLPINTYAVDAITMA